MAITLGIDLHKTARAVNLAIAIFAISFLLAGIFFSFYLHFFTVTFIFLNLINAFYLYVQRRHTLLRNFGLLAQTRYFLESLGPEMRQYLFASDTEERPFNREERSEIYRKSLNLDSALAFGSTGQFDAHEIKIRHSMFPLNPENVDPYRVTFGEERGIDTAYTITKPVLISAMSYGALGQPAIRSLARGAKRAGIAMNTGEGGYPKYHLMENCDLIFQMGTAKFGVRNDDGSLNDEKLRELASETQIRMIEVKLSQGAKPGKGGLLPKEKVSREISELRGVPQDRDVVSPPTHVECSNVENTVGFIRHVQEVSGLPVGIKLCLGSPREFRTLAEEMKAQQTFPDWIAIDGAEGGTGAAPKSFMDQVGMPLLPALFNVQTILVKLGIRDQLKILAGGKRINAGRVLVALALGADACYTARGFMLSLGCIQALQCGKNTCPVGITTHDPALQRGLDIARKSQRIVNFVHHLNYDFKQLLAATGKVSYRELTYKDIYIPSGTDLYNVVFPNPMKT